MKLTNRIHLGALALPIIPAVYSTTFEFYIPTGLSALVEYDRIIRKWDTSSDEIELTYSDHHIAAYDLNRWCFDKSSSALGQPGVPMQQDRTNVCNNLQKYENIVQISFQAPTDESQGLRINMPDYELQVSYQAEILA